MKPNLLRKIIPRAALAGALLLPGLSIAAPQALTHANPNVKAIIAVQNSVTHNLMAVPDVIGTAVGLDAQGEPALLVFVNQEGKNPAEVAQLIPSRIQGATVVVQMTEPFRALAGKTAPTPTPAPSHQAIQTPPISLGTSGGWRQDLANGYCCGGTLGSLVQKDGTNYILSNYHVLESDIVTGGNDIIAQAGDPVCQPGLIDVNCNATNAQNVATLSGIKSLPGSNVDAALAAVIPGMVREDGNILQIGVLSAATEKPAIGQKVKKSGRSSALTRSSVSGLNATVSISYENECAGGPYITKTFTGQILMNNRVKGKSFLIGGDSGSLMVQDVTILPKAIGLLFAGSSTIAIANPIDEVLAYFNATMVGQ